MKLTIKIFYTDDAFSIQWLVSMEQNLDPSKKETIREYWK